MNPRSLMRPDIVRLDDVAPPPSALEAVRLDANENPYGPSPGVFAALTGIRPEYYPDPGYTRLRRALAGYLSVSAEQIICSAGADEMLEIILRLFLAPGDEVITLPPTFVMYRHVTLYNHGRVVEVPRGESFTVDVAAVGRAVTDRTKVIFLCNPNNPTGNLAGRDAVERLLATQKMVVVDEAYAEFAGTSVVDLAAASPNLIILRTMSKWAALAGLRLGYAVVHPSVAEQMMKAKAPFNVGVASEAAGMAALEDREYLMRNVTLIVEERERLRARLEALGRGHVYPSHTNFLYWETDDAGALQERLARSGVLVRAFAYPRPALRITAGTPQQSAALMAALEEAYAALAG
ncbi:MAG TPA: histidinol-phosphate transaminase [Chloroflexota bacterium]|nr:histidinol-phosphate transaminase [Chloroflexota bacterium]